MCNFPGTMGLLGVNVFSVRLHMTTRGCPYCSSYEMSLLIAIALSNFPLAGSSGHATGTWSAEMAMPRDELTGRDMGYDDELRTWQQMPMHSGHQGPGFQGIPGAWYWQHEVPGYRGIEEMASTPPISLSDQQRYNLSWEAG